MNEILIAKLKQNDRSAQKELYETLFGRMNAVCLRYVKDWDNSMEVTNTGFYKVFKNMHQFKNEGSFEGWVRRIIVNTALDYLKETKNYRSKMQVDSETVETYNSSVENEIISKFNLDELLRLVEMLPPMAKLVFNMYAIDGFPHKEIAEHLSINEVTSRTYLHSARTKLKKLLTTHNIDITI